MQRRKTHSEPDTELQNDTSSFHTSHDLRKDRFLNIVIAFLSLIVVVLAISLVIRLYNPPAELISLPSESTAADSVESVEQSAPKSVIRVEVLNGSGVAGLAAKVTNHLRKKGFDVISTGNADSFGYKITIIQDRTGETENARKVADVLGLTDKNIVEQKNPDLYLEVTVIIGKDYKLLKLND